MRSCWDVRVHFASKILLSKPFATGKIQKVLVGLWIGFIPVNPIAQTTCPNPGMCFISQKAKDQWASEHNCVFGPSGNNKDCSEQWRADSHFLAVQEGALISDGYVPKYKRNIKDKSGKVIHKKGDVIGQSGVTISTGVDLGQQSNAGTKKIINDYIKQFGNPDNVDVDALLKKLDPYFLKKKEKAVAALDKQPLHVSPAEDQLLANAFGFYTQEQVAIQFDKKNTAGMTFKQLPKEAQTVIVDFAYQYGLSDTKGAIRQKFWGYVYAGQWQDLANWLASSPDEYIDRRNSEGSMLQSAIDTGILPSSGNPCSNS